MARTAQKGDLQQGQLTSIAMAAPQVGFQWWGSTGGVWHEKA